MTKIIDNTNLGYLISKIKSAFWPKTDVVQIGLDDTPTANSNNLVKSGGVKSALDTKQETLVSGTNIKTINNESLLGSGNINITGGSGGGGEANVIEAITFNGTPATITNKTAAITATIPDNVFIATYGTTTNTEIRSAMSAGKLVYVVKDGKTYICGTDDGVAIYFYSIDYDESLLYSIGINGAGNWITNTTTAISHVDPGYLNTTATTSQSTSSNEFLGNNITLHKVSKTGSYNDLLNKPDVVQILGVYSVNAGKVFKAAFQVSSFNPQLILVIHKDGNPDKLLSITQYAYGDNCFIATDLTGACEYLYQDNGKVYLYQDGSFFGIRAGDSNIKIEVIALYKDSVGIDYYIEDWSSGWINSGYDPIEIQRLATVNQIPAAITESTVAGWGFTKNAGTLTTETDPVFSASAAAGITASDITNWNGKTSNTGTVTGVKMNGTTNNPTSGVVDLGTVLTSYTETDPTVPSWAKASTKPTYTASEVGALPLAGGTMDSGAEIYLPGSSSLGETKVTRNGVSVSPNASSFSTVTNYKHGSILYSPDGMSLNTISFPAATGTIALTSDIPSAVTESTVSNWGFTKNNGTITGITMNGASKGTSGVVDLGTVITSETSLSKGTTTGGGNAVTDISVSGHTITLTKGSTFLTSETSLSKGTTTGTGNVVTDLSVSGHTVTLTKGSTVPVATSANAGKIPRITSAGAWEYVTPAQIYSGSAAPNNSNGNNGDIYVQT